MGSILYFSKIHGFRGTHGTHANYAPVLYIQGFTIKFHSLSIVPISLFSTVTLGHFLSHKLGSCVGLPEKNIAQFSRITFRILNLSACFMLFTHSVSLCLKLNGYFLIRDYKTAKFQSWRSEKNSATRPDSNHTRAACVRVPVFFHISNFDLSSVSSVAPL